MLSCALLGVAGMVAVMLTGCGDVPEPGEQPVTALLVIDVQKCFLEGGSLAVPASHIVEHINDMMGNKSCLFDHVIFSQDFHPAKHISFASTHGLQPFAHLNGKGGLPLMCIKPASGKTEDSACCPKSFIDPSSVNCTVQLCPNYGTDKPDITEDNDACTTCGDPSNDCMEYDQEMWTDHCLETGDSGFPSSLNMPDNPVIVQKGMNQHVDAYSAFKDNSKSLETTLRAELESRKVTDLVVVGIATDVCVLQTVVDGLDYKYRVTVVGDATAAVRGDENNFNAAIQEMRDRGATITSVADVLDTDCNSRVARDASRVVV